MSPGGLGDPQTARGLRELRGWGQFKEVSAGARVRRREDLMGFFCWWVCLCTEDPGTPLWSSSPRAEAGGGGGKRRMGSKL